MSEEQLKAFLEKVKGDTSLQEKLKAAADSNAVVEIAKEAGFMISAEEIQSMQSESVELSDEELEGLAGGATPWGILAVAAGRWAYELATNGKHLRDGSFDRC